MEKLKVGLDLFKKHLNVDFEDDDMYLESILQTAQCSIEKYIQRPLSDCEQDGMLNPMLKHAILIFGGTLYDNRESVSYGQPKAVPYNLEYLIKPFIKYR